jgi:ferredoxin
MLARDVISSMICIECGYNDYNTTSLPKAGTVPYSYGTIYGLAIWLWMDVEMAPFVGRCIYICRVSHLCVATNRAHSPTRSKRLPLLFDFELGIISRDS